MLFAFVVLYSGALPPVSLAKDSDCAGELCLSGFTCVEDASLKVALRNRRLTIHRAGTPALVRELGPGSCLESSRAVVVIFERWSTTLGFSVSDAGSSATSAPSGAPSSRGAAQARAAPVTFDGGSSSGPPGVVQHPPVLVPGSESTPSAPLKSEAASTVPLAERSRSLEVAARPQPVPTAQSHLSEDAQSSAAPPVLNAGLPMPLSEEPKTKRLEVVEVQTPPLVSAPVASSADASRQVPFSVRPSAPAEEAPQVEPSASSEVSPSPRIPPGDDGDSVGRVDVTRLEALVGGGVALPGAPTFFGALLSAEGALLFNRRVRLTLSGAFDFGGTVSVFDEAGHERGKLTTRGGQVLPGAAWCWRPTSSNGMDGAFRVCGGAVFGARIVEGTSTGPYVYQQTFLRTVAFVVGPNLQVAFLWGRWLAALDLIAAFTPTPSRFSIEGLPTTLGPPAIQGQLRLSVGLGFDR